MNSLISVKYRKSNPIKSASTEHKICTYIVNVWSYFIGAEKVKRQEELIAAYFLGHAHSTLTLGQCVAYLPLLVLQLNCIFLSVLTPLTVIKFFFVFTIFSTSLVFPCLYFVCHSLLKMHMNFSVLLIYFVKFFCCLSKIFISLI